MGGINSRLRNSVHVDELAAILARIGVALIVLSVCQLAFAIADLAVGGNSESLAANGIWAGAIPGLVNGITALVLGLRVYITHCEILYAIIMASIGIAFSIINVILQAVGLARDAPGLPSTRTQVAIDALDLLFGLSILICTVLELVVCIYIRGDIRGITAI